MYDYNGDVHHNHPDCKNATDQTSYREIKKTDTFVVTEHIPKHLWCGGFTAEMTWSCKWNKMTTEIGKTIAAPSAFCRTRTKIEHNVLSKGWKSS
jgi:hypothetical protein